MAKYKVKSIVFNGEYANLEFESGEKSSVNSTKEGRIKTVKPGDEIEGELKEWKNKKGEIQLFFNYPKEGGKSGFKPNPRKDALTLAVQLVCSGKITFEQMYPASDKLLNYLKGE